MFGLDTFQSVVSTMSDSAKSLNQFKDTAITVTESLNNNLVKPVYESVKTTNAAIETYEKAKEIVSITLEDFSGEITSESLEKAFCDFDSNWDDFSKRIVNLYQKLPESLQKDISDKFSNTSFYKNILEAGEKIKETMPDLFQGINNLQNISDSFKNFSGNPIYDAIKIKKGIDNILDSTKKITDSIDKLTDNKFSETIYRITNDSKILSAVNSCLTSITQNINDKLYKPFSEIVGLTEKSIGIYDSSKILLDILVNDFSGKITIESLAKATTSFKTNYNQFTGNINTLFKCLPNGPQNYIIGVLEKHKFIGNVTNAGNVIISYVPDILTGITDFKESIDVFEGSYRDPLVAINKINNGVQGIVNATEKIADSINNIYKNLKGNNNEGIPILDSLSNIQDNELVKSVSNTLQACNDMASLVKNIKNIDDIIKSKDPKLIQSSLSNITNSLTKISDYKSDNHISETASKQDTNKTSENNDSNQDNEQDKKENKSDNQATGDSYVTSTATLRCPFGDNTSKLTVYPDRTVYLSNKPMANISDHISMYNIAPFGKCRSLAYPATAAATAAAHGKLTPMPCVPNTTMPWIGGKTDYLIKGQPALLKSCTCPCMWGGTISITNDGQ